MHNSLCTGVLLLFLYCLLLINLFLVPLLPAHNAAAGKLLDRFEGLELKDESIISSSVGVSLVFSSR